VYAQSKVLGWHFQIGQALQVSASSSDGFRTITSLTVGILFTFFFCHEGTKTQRENQKLKIKMTNKNSERK